MQLLDVNFDPRENQLRQFGWISTAAFPLIGAFILWRGGLLGISFGGAATGIGVAFCLLGALCGALAYLRPVSLRPLYVGLIVVTYPIGFVLSYVIMGLIFYGLFTPVGLIFRVIGRDPLQRAFDREAETYWVKPRVRESKDSYFKQF